MHRGIDANRAFTFAWAVGVLATACVDSTGSNNAPATPLSAVTDLEGRPASLYTGDRPSVFIFVRTDCPISNRYVPVINELTETYRDRANFFSVFVSARENPGSVREYMRSYELQTTAVLDPHLQLALHTGARVTPEVAVSTPSRGVIYRGRIDDRFVAFGKARPRAANHDLKNALDDALAGRPIRTATTTAIGCYIDDLKHLDHH